MDMDDFGTLSEQEKALRQKLAELEKDHAKAEKRLKKAEKLNSRCSSRRRRLPSVPEERTSFSEEQSSLIFSSSPNSFEEPLTCITDNIQNNTSDISKHSVTKQRLDVRKHIEILEEIRSGKQPGYTYPTDTLKISVTTAETLHAQTDTNSTRANKESPKDVLLVEKDTEISQIQARSSSQCIDIPLQSMVKGDGHAEIGTNSTRESTDDVLLVEKVTEISQRQARSSSQCIDTPLQARVKGDDLRTYSQVSQTLAEPLPEYSKSSSQAQSQEAPQNGLTGVNNTRELARDDSQAKIPYCKGVQVENIGGDPSLNLEKKNHNERPQLDKQLLQNNLGSQPVHLNPGFNSKQQRDIQNAHVYVDSVVEKKHDKHNKVIERNQRTKGEKHLVDNLEYIQENNEDVGNPEAELIVSPSLETLSCLETVNSSQSYLRLSQTVQSNSNPPPIKRTGLSLSSRKKNRIDLSQGSYGGTQPFSKKYDNLESTTPVLAGSNLRIHSLGVNSKTKKMVSKTNTDDSKSSQVSTHQTCCVVDSTDSTLFSTNTNKMTPQNGSSPPCLVIEGAVCTMSPNLTNANKPEDSILLSTNVNTDIMTPQYAPSSPSLTREGAICTTSPNLVNTNKPEDSILLSTNLNTYKMTPQYASSSPSLTIESAICTTSSNVANANKSEESSLGNNKTETKQESNSSLLLDSYLANILQEDMSGPRRSPRLGLKSVRNDEHDKMIGVLSQQHRQNFKLTKLQTPKTSRTRSKPKVSSQPHKDNISCTDGAKIFPSLSKDLFKPGGPLHSIVDFSLPDKEFAKLKLEKIKQRMHTCSQGSSGSSSLSQWDMTNKMGKKKKRKRDDSILCYKKLEQLKGLEECDSTKKLTEILQASKVVDIQVSSRNANSSLGIDIGGDSCEDAIVDQTKEDICSDHSSPNVNITSDYPHAFVKDNLEEEVKCSEDDCTSGQFFFGSTSVQSKVISKNSHGIENVTEGSVHCDTNIVVDLHKNATHDHTKCKFVECADVRLQDDTMCDNEQQLVPDIKEINWNKQEVKVRVGEDSRSKETDNVCTSSSIEIQNEGIGRNMEAYNNTEKYDRSNAEPTRHTLKQGNKQLSVSDNIIPSNAADVTEVIKQSNEYLSGIHGVPKDIAAMDGVDDSQNGDVNSQTSLFGTQGSQILSPYKGESASPCCRAELPAQSSSIPDEDEEEDQHLINLSPVLIKACLQHDLKAGSNKVHSVALGSVCGVTVSGYIVREVVAVCLNKMIVLWSELPGQSWDILHTWHLQQSDTEEFRNVLFVPVNSHIVLFAGGNFTTGNGRVYGLGEKSDYILDMEDDNDSISNTNEYLLMHLLAGDPSVSSSTKTSCEYNDVEMVLALKSTDSYEVQITKWTLDGLCLNVNKCSVLPIPPQTKNVNSIVNVHGNSSLLLALCEDKLLLWNHKTRELLTVVDVMKLSYQTSLCLKASCRRGMLFLVFLADCKDEDKEETTGVCQLSAINPKTGKSFCLKSNAIGSICSPSFSSLSNQHMAVGDNSGNVKFCNIVSGHVAKLRAFQEGVSCVKFHSNRPIMVAGSNGGCVHLYSIC